MSAITAPTRTAATASAAGQRVNPARQAGWDALVASLPGASFFHGAAWAEVLETAYDYTPVYFTSNEAGTLRGLLPMMEVNSWLTGRRGISLPFTDDCEPLCADAGMFKNLHQSVMEHGRERGWKYVEFRGGRHWLGDVPASVAFYGHELDLSGGEQTLSERVDSAVRRAIRKAEKEGVKVEVADTLESTRDFYALMCKTRQRHGLPPQPFHFFRNIHKRILSKKQGVVVLARFQGRPVAGAMYFRFGSRGIYRYGASDESHQQLRGNNLVMWEAMKWHARAGVKTLHLGRTSLGNEGLRRFKLGWGAVEQRIEYVKYDLRRESFVTEQDGASGWHNKFFNRAPIALSRMIGAGLYRHWA